MAEEILGENESEIGTDLFPLLLLYGELGQDILEVMVSAGFGIVFRDVLVYDVQVFVHDFLQIADR
jgi:hypothetical protein